MKILITGGLGFIGINLINKLIKNKNNLILNIDKESKYSTKNSKLHFKNSKNYKFYKLDLVKNKSLSNKVIKYNPDIIFHLAAESHVDRSIKQPNNFIYSNIIGTYNLLKISEKLHKKNNNFKFLYVSTDEVYGSLKLDDQKYFTEKSNYKPNSPYSASKAAGDLLVRSWNKTFNLPTVTTHCSNNYGPWQNPEKLIPLVINNILNNKKIPIYGNGKNIRDWIHVNDHIEALLKISKIKFKGQVYNIGANNLIDNISLVKKICNIIDKKLNLKKTSKELINFVEDRKGHDLKYAINSKQLKKDTKFVAKTKFKNGLEKTINWYLENKKWLIKK